MNYQIGNKTNSDLNYYDNNSEKELINEQLKEELRDPQRLKGLY